jgi:hypothetical protein
MLHKLALFIIVITVIIGIIILIIFMITITIILCEKRITYAETDCVISFKSNDDKFVVFVIIYS